MSGWLCAIKVYGLVETWTGCIHIILTHNMVASSTTGKQKKNNALTFGQGNTVY